MYKQYEVTNRPNEKNQCMSNGAPIFIYTHQQTKQELAKVILHESKPNADILVTRLRNIISGVQPNQAVVKLKSMKL